MTVSWTSYHEVEVTDADMQETITMVKNQLANGYNEPTALNNAVDDLITSWEDYDYYAMTDETYDQIRTAIKAELSKT